jgi:hypothetical protein
MGVGIAVVALGLLYAIAVAVSAVRLRRAYAALEKDGRPMRVADIIPPEVPDTENAALLYESAALLLRATPAPEKGNLRGYLADLSEKYVDRPHDPNTRAQLQQLFQQKTVSQALSIIAEATRRPACRSKYDYDTAPSIMMPDLAGARETVRILRAKACLEVEAGESNAAWDTAQTMVIVSDARRAEPLIINQLVRMGTIGVSCKTIQRLCETTLPTESQYRRLTSCLETLDDVRPLIRAGDGERLLMGERTFTLPKDQLYKVLWDNVFGKSYWPPIVHRLRFAWITFKPNFLGDRAAYMRLMTEQTQLLDQPYSRDWRDRLEREYVEVSGRYFLTRTLMPSMYAIKSLHCRMIADVHITCAGLALLRHKAAHGDFPATLDVLGLKGVDDPFSGKPLLYRAEGKGFVLYSVAEDQKDNGGTPKPKRQDADPRKKPAEYDQVWRFPNPDVQ